jgi:low temperature requirement protein LtrA
MTPETNAVDARDVRTSTLELFFDLVFVFTVTQVASIVEQDPSWRSTAQAVLELLVIFWMYGGFAWLTNAIGSATLKRRLLLLMGMAAFFVRLNNGTRAIADGRERERYIAQRWPS